MTNNVAMVNMINEVKKAVQKYLDLRDANIVSQDILLLRIAGSLRYPQVTGVDIAFYDDIASAKKGACIRQIDNQRRFHKFFGNFGKNDLSGDNNREWDRVDSIHESYSRIFISSTDFFTEYVIDMRYVDTVDDLDR